MQYFRVACLGVIASLLSSPSFSEGKASILWKSLDGWAVYADPTLGNACYIATVYEEGTLLRLGFDFSSNPRSVYLGLSNEKWKSLDAGKEYPIKIQFDRNPVWDAAATARDMGDYNLLVVKTTDVNFVSEFSRKLTIRVEFAGRQIVNLRLDKSAKAISEMLNCQDAVTQATSSNNGAQPKEDPFEQTAPVSSSSDPFEL